MIQVRLHPGLDLIIHTVTGALEEDEFRGAVIAMYQLDPPPLLSLWDFSEASVGHFGRDRIHAVQADLVGKVRGREGGRTAAVAPSDLTFASGRQYAALAEGFELPFVHHVSRTRDEALAWLGIEPASLAAAESREVAPANGR